MPCAHRVHKECIRRSYLVGMNVPVHFPLGTRLAARFMGASTDKGTLRRERTMEHSLEPQCEPSRKRHLAESATRARPSRPKAAIRRLPDGPSWEGWLMSLGGLAFRATSGWWEAPSIERLLCICFTDTTRIRLAADR